MHTLLCGELVDFLADPGDDEASPAIRHQPQGAIWIVDGIIRASGPRRAVEAQLKKTLGAAAEYRILDHGEQLIVPGFIDCHMHYAQIGVMASWGRQLLDWLERYTFPAEAAFADPQLAAVSAEFVIDRLLAHGTTTASVFATVHAHSVDAFMQIADRRSLRMVCGKVMMDRNCPEGLRDTVALAAREIPELIARWHRRGRLRYSLTPRFAPTSTPAQLQLAGELYRSEPDLHLQSHLSENLAEIAWVRELFPHHADYFDVYEQAGLAGERAIYGHCLHLAPREIDAMAASRTAVAFCPTSNLFLGSGTLDVSQLLDAGIAVGLASDIGGGSSLSLLRTMAAAYQHAALRGARLTPARAWYLATLGGARALALEKFIGNFLPGKEADCVVLDPVRIPELGWRVARAETLSERLFALMMLGDERCVVQTYVMGKAALPEFAGTL